MAIQKTQLCSPTPGQQTPSRGERERAHKLWQMPATTHLVYCLKHSLDFLLPLQIYCCEAGPVYDREALAHLRIVAHGLAQV